MRFIASNMYCKYVINTLDEAINSKQKKGHIDNNNILQEKLLDSYKKLEELLKLENNNK